MSSYQAPQVSRVSVGWRNPRRCLGRWGSHWLTDSRHFCAHSRFSADFRCCHALIYLLKFISQRFVTIFDTFVYLRRGEFTFRSGILEEGEDLMTFLCGSAASRTGGSGGGVTSGAPGEVASVERTANLWLRALAAQVVLFKLVQRICVAAVQRLKQSDVIASNRPTLSNVCHSSKCYLLLFLLAHLKHYRLRLCGVNAT